MARYFFALACVILAVPSWGQGGPPLPLVFSFEAQTAPGPPRGWTGSPGAIFADDQVVHSGKWAARIENKNTDSFTTITNVIPIDFSGKSIQYRAFMRAEGVEKPGGLWMRQDGAASVLAFESMQGQQLKPSQEWAEFTLTFPLHKDATRLFIGALVSGTGKAWVDDIQVLVDGKAIWDLPKVEKPKTPLDLDHEFDTGSKISLSSLSRVQIANLAKLGRVWGFLKYHHPRVTSGKQHWDYDLFRVMPAILAASDYAAADAALAKWIAGLGEVEACTSCAELKTGDLHLQPQVDWIDEMELPALRSIYRNRVPGKQFYVSKVPQGTGNPSFDNEPAYPQIKPPDAGFQLLGLFRFWNIIAYWFPYRDVIGENWTGVLTEFIPRIGLAKDSETYAREMMQLIARVHDTHANLWSSLQVRPPTGTCQLPVHMRFVGNQAVVAAHASFNVSATGLKIGDVVTDLDGTPVSKLVETWKPYYAASNEPTVLRDMARQMTRGNCGETTVRISRGSEPIELKATRVPVAGLLGSVHDRPGETFQMLPDQIAYLKLSSVKIADAASYIDRAAGSKGLIIDIRNYPSEFMVFALGSLLVNKGTEFVSFTSMDVSNPGAFHWNPPVKLTPGKLHYPGKVILLVDEVSQSQAEYTTMAFRSSGAKVIGSTTAGADGNVSTIPLPGGLRSMISGLGVFYPDKTPTQRIGILPDTEVKPTIAGIREGRDELLEEAVRQILTTSGGTPAKP